LVRELFGALTVGKRRPKRDVGWKWAFAFLAAGPLVGTLAMLRLRATRL
jgi:hypothetical protein